METKIWVKQMKIFNGKGKLNRTWTKRSYQLMQRIRKIILVLTSPIWLPIYLIQGLAYYISHFLEETIYWMDGLLDKILNNTIPQLKDKKSKQINNCPTCELISTGGMFFDAECEEHGRGGY